MTHGLEQKFQNDATLAHAVVQVAATIRDPGRASPRPVKLEEQVQNVLHFIRSALAGDAFLANPESPSSQYSGQFRPAWIAAKSYRHIFGEGPQEGAAFRPYLETLSTH